MGESNNFRANAPFCCVCGRPVGGFTLEVSPDMASMAFTARCHGETEVAIITMQEMCETRRLPPRMAFEKSPAEGAAS